MFIECSEESKAYNLYNPLAKKVAVDRDVIFSEEASCKWIEEDKTKINK